MEPKPLPPPDPTPSLTQRLGSMLDRREGQGTAAGAGRLGVMLALLLPLGPLATVVGAEVMTMRQRALASTAGQGEAAREAEAALAERHLLTTLAPSSLSTILDAVARTLPAEDRLVTLSIEDGNGGDARLKASIATADPDRLRAALARSPITAGLRSTDERRGDGVLIVSLEADR